MAPACRASWTRLPSSKLINAMLDSHMWCATHRFPPSPMLQTLAAPYPIGWRLGAPFSRIGEDRPAHPPTCSMAASLWKAATSMPNTLYCVLASSDWRQRPLSHP